MIGLRVGPFEIEREADVPVEGDWFLAARTGTTRRRPTHVLVKLLQPDADQAQRTALQAEYDALRLVEDSRVPRAIGYYEGTGAMVLDAVGGAPLGAIVQARSSGSMPMTPATLCDLGLDLSECLQHAHHKGKHHGHLSPEKLWLSHDGRLWVWGFGRADDAPVEWLPPERARELPASSATDQWSLGALLASLITGQAPWTSTEEARRGSSDAHIDTIEVQWPALGRLLRRMLDPEPSRRFPDLGPVRQELLALSRKAGGLSERRELAISLAEHAPEPEPPAPEPLAPIQTAAAPTGEAPQPTLATEDDVTVRQAPVAGPDLAEAEARLEPLGRLASPGNLADEAIPVVRPDLTEDLPAAVVGKEPSQESPMTSNNSGKPDEPASEPAEEAAAEEASEEAEAKPAVPVRVEYSDDALDDDDQWEDDGYDDGDEEATQIVDAEAVQRAIAEARAAAGLDDAKSQDATATLPPDSEMSDAGVQDSDPGVDEEEAATVMFSTGRSENIEGVLEEVERRGPGTNPTAVPWTDPGGEYGGKKPKQPTNSGAAEPKVVLPDGELPKPLEPREMPREQQFALGIVAVMLLVAAAYFLLQT
ncbi:MAG: protein kinase [Proteobacteria bacterium]|nr:protein kinase [Pseudomonadota bacterium]